MTYSPYNRNSLFFEKRNIACLVAVDGLPIVLWNQELVQSALLESNTGRDDHILYNKLVRMADI